MNVHFLVLNMLYLHYNLGVKMSISDFFFDLFTKQTLFIHVLRYCNQSFLPTSQCACAEYPECKQ